MCIYTVLWVTHNPRLCLHILVLYVCLDCSALVMCAYIFAHMRSINVKQSISLGAVVQSTGLLKADKEYGSYCQVGLSMPLPAQNR